MITPEDREEIQEDAVRRARFLEEDFGDLEAAQELLQFASTLKVPLFRSGVVGGMPVGNCEAVVKEKRPKATACIAERAREEMCDEQKYVDLKAEKMRPRVFCQNRLLIG